MATEKYLMIDLEDEKTIKIADILGNKTAKKILDVLAEKNEASETDLSNELGIPINTVEYNLKKLFEAGLVEKAKNFFWSRKGKKIEMYKLAKKHIVISHKSKPSYSKLRSIVPVVLISGAIAFLMRYLTKPEFLQAGKESADNLMATGVAESARTSIEIQGPFLEKLLALPNWEWFFAGALIALIIMILLNWRKL